MAMIEITAKTTEEAIEIALKELEAERQDVEIDVVSKGKPGILGIGSEPAKVRVTILETTSDLVRIATEVLQELLKRASAEVMITLKQAYREDIGGPVFDIDGEDAGLLIGRRGETLRALQFMVNSLVSRRMDERVNILVDVAGYQQRRHDFLATLAAKIAKTVGSSGRSIALEPMPPNERRIVHLALADYGGVTTSSTGVGEGRKVVVEPNVE